jgi:hypothetical protein
LVFDRNNLIIDMNLFFEDVVKSIDLFIPLVTNQYKSNFEKSIKSQYKKLTVSHCMKRKDVKRGDFPFLE